MTNSTDSEFSIIDFDRTLADSDKLLEVFMEIADSYSHISKEEIARVDAEIKQRGDTFFLARYIREKLNADGRVDEWLDLEKRFIHESRALNYLLPGAAEFLQWHEDNSKRYGILTYGDHLWQRLKLTAAGFNHVPRIILEQKEKSKFIQRWRHEDGSYKIPDAFGGGMADRVVMYDDKAVSFAGFPELPSVGFWVLDHSKALLSQKGEVPSNVNHADNLYEVIDYLNTNSYY